MCEKWDYYTMAGWPQLDYAANVVQVLDAKNSVLWIAPDLTVLSADPTYSAFSVNVTSALPIYLRIGDTYHIGIDNIRFSQGPISDPEPVSLTLLALGGVALIFGRRTRR